MALVVWLPLNGNLNNQGASAYTISSIETTPTFTTGKIGQCYQRANSNAQLTNGLKIEDNLVSTLGTTASIAVWVKPLGTHTHYNGTIMSSGDWNRQKWAFGVSQDNSKVDVLCGGYNNYITCAVPTNEWTHLVSTFDNGTCKLYKNGVYVGQLTGQAAFVSDATWTGICRESYASGYFGFNGCINDLRLYNHCLSAAEVHEISQGLVLHYKLDGFQGGYGNKNLLAKYVVPGQAGPTSVANGGRTTWLGDYKITIPATENADTYFRLFMTEQLTSGTTYTISCKVSGLLSGSYYRFPLFSQSNTSMGVLNLDHNGLCSLTFTMNWTGTQTAATGANGETVYVNFLDDSARALASGQGAITLYDFKLEKGSSATAWCPSDASLTQIQDSSGYGHNGSILGDVKISSDTARYQSSIDLLTASTAINCGRGGMVTDSITVNIWLKSNAWNNPVSCTEGGGWNFEASGEYFRFPIYISGVGYKYGQSSTTKAQLCNNQWHMLTGIYDRINQKIQIYVDGQLDNDYAAGTSNNIGYNGSNVIWIAAEASGSNTSPANYGMRGLFSDFRIYCTALSAADVKQLYEVGAKVDNKQNLHVYEIEETNYNLLAGKIWTTGYSIHTPLTNAFTNFNSNGEYQFTANNTSASTEYIPINPSGHTYEYDYTISVNAGNQFYIGFERYDANKTARSNNACVYTYATKPSTDVVKQHFKGTVDLSTDGTNPCAFITLRILNGWSGTTSGVTGTATIHSFSLREIGTKQQPKLKKTGIFIEEELKEEIATKLHKSGIVETNNLIEF